MTWDQDQVDSFIKSSNWTNFDEKFWCLNTSIAILPNKSQIFVKCQTHWKVIPYRIIKWPTQVINWPTPLGCLNCWQMAVSGWVRKGGPIYARIWILIEKLVISLMIMDIFQASLFKLGTQVHN